MVYIKGRLGSLQGALRRPAIVVAAYLACWLLLALAEEVTDVLEECGLPPGRLRLELTESALTAQTGAVGAVLESVAEAGVTVALDDFGTGYSPLSNLKDLPAGAVKIDRSFVAGLPGDGRDAAIVGAIVTMAKGMGIKVVAEGVENDEQLAFLREVGCEEVQGFLLGRPVPASEIIEVAGTAHLREEA